MGWEATPGGGMEKSMGWYMQTYHQLAIDGLYKSQ